MALTDSAGTNANVKGSAAAVPFPHNTTGTLKWYQPKAGADHEATGGLGLGRYSAGDIVTAWQVSNCQWAAASATTACTLKMGDEAVHKTKVALMDAVAEDTTNDKPARVAGELTGAAALAAGTTVALLALAL